MAFLFLLLRIAGLRVHPVRRITQHPGAIDYDMRLYLKSYFTGDGLLAECAAFALFPPSTIES
jgi:hypothetical protein